jgi:hypothetical protein
MLTGPPGLTCSTIRVVERMHAIGACDKESGPTPGERQRTAGRKGSASQPGADDVAESRSCLDDTQDVPNALYVRPMALATRDHKISSVRAMRQMTMSVAHISAVWKDRSDAIQCHFCISQIPFSFDLEFI